MKDPAATHVHACTYIGPEQDPRKAPVTYCGKPTLQGKSYCLEHYPVVYMVGSSVNRKRVNAKIIEDELAKLMAEQAEEMEE